MFMLTWLLHGLKESWTCIDIYDEVGIASGASGIAGGLQPYSPRDLPVMLA